MTQGSLFDTHYTLADAIAELRREAAMRARVYPDEIAADRLTEDEAARRFERWSWALCLLTDSPVAPGGPVSRREAVAGAIAELDREAGQRRRAYPRMGISAAIAEQRAALLAIARARLVALRAELAARHGEGRP